MTTTNKRRDVRGFTTLDDHLREEGALEEFQAVAIKEVLAWQVAQAMKQNNISKRRMAAQMGTSRSQIDRSQIDRLLDPRDGNVTIATLQRAAALLGRKVRLELV